MQLTNSDRFFPERGALQEDILRFRDRVINRWSTYRNRHMGRIAMSFWYHLGRQWAEFDTEAMFEGVRGAILREVDTDDLPRPVTNEITVAMESEMVSFVSRGWIPTITPTSNDPRIKAAAQVAKDQLQYRLEQIHWPAKRRMNALHFAVGGTGLLYSKWDKSYFDLRTIGAPTAVTCPSCNLRLYSPELPLETMKAGINGQPIAHTDTVRGVESDEEQLVHLTYCPVCQELSELKPYSPTPREALEGDDVFGRPLGVQEPRGGTDIEADVPFEFYPQNGGIRVSPFDLKRFGRRKIRSMEWLEERYPHVVHLVQPDPPSELLYDDPMLGEWSILGHWSPSLDTGILDNHVNVDEVVEEPSFRHPLGRYVVATKDLVLEDSNLLESEEVEGEKLWVPRVMMSVSRFKIRPLEIWGTTGPDDGISPQNRLNGIDAQLIESRLRMGSPHVFMPRDMWIDNPVRMQAEWGVGKIFLFEPSISQPNFNKPEVFGGTLFPQDVYLERDRAQNDLRRIMGPSDVSRGMAPKNVGATSGLQILLEQDEKSRSIREQEFVEAAERAWSHLSQLEWVLRVDEDVYRVLGPDGAWKYSQYLGATLRGQTEVKIEAAPFIGKSVVRREAAREAIADGLASPDSPISRRRLREAYGIDSDLPMDEDLNNQIDQAERQWVDFVDKGIVRVQDSIDDPGIRLQVLTMRLTSEEGQRITEEAGWDEIARAIAGWDRELQQANAVEQQVLAFYGARLQGPEAEQAYAKAMNSWTDQMEVYKRQVGVYNQQMTTPESAATSTAPVPPPKPPPPIFLPALPQDRILMVWGGMLEKAGISLEENQPAPVVSSIAPQPKPALTRSTYVQFRALVEAYRLAVMPMQPAAPPPPAASPAANAPANTGKVGAPPPAAPLPEGGRK